MAKNNTLQRIEDERSTREQERLRALNARHHRRLQGRRRRRKGGHWRPEDDPTRRVVPRVVNVPPNAVDEAPAAKKAAVPGGAIGRKAGRSTLLAGFIRMNGEAEFNIAQLNAMDFTELVREAKDDGAAVVEILDDFERIVGRVRDELSDALAAGGVLRAMTKEWLKESPQDGGWHQRASRRWAGLFAETRIPGGSLRPSLVERLARLHTEVLGVDTRAGHRIRRAFALHEGGRDGGSKDVLRARAAQAYLDDLASNAARMGEPIALPRLAELAQSAGVEKLTAALRILFASDAGDSIAVLHPSRYPGLPLVSLRPPSPLSRSAFIAFTITCTPPAAASPPSTGATDDQAPLSAAPDGLWERAEVSADAWHQILKGLYGGKGQLDVPPLLTYRESAPYRTLQQVVLDDPEAARQFLAVRWKGKPTGLSFVAQLSSEGSYVPEYETDPDYLEAELGHALKGDPDFVPADGRWLLRGVHISRTVGAPGEVRYVAQRVDPE